MEHPHLHYVGMPSTYVGALQQGLRGLRFRHHKLEQAFRAMHLEHSVHRGRMAGIVAIALTLCVAGITWWFAPAAPSKSIEILLLGVLAPWLLLCTGLLYLKDGTRRYTVVAAVAVIVSGFVVTYLCQTASIAGAAWFMAGEELVMVYALLFLGMLFNISVLIGVLLIAMHVGMGLAVGLALEPLLFIAAILVATAFIAARCVYQLELAVRVNFLEIGVLQEAAERDSVTGLFNRRVFDDHLERLWRQAQREGQSLELVFIDIDHFKAYNDLYGHQAGDACLKQVALAIERCAKRPLDFCARYGGEEFVLVVYGPPEDYSRSLPEKIRYDVMERAIRHEGSGVASVVTISVGAALMPPGTHCSLQGGLQRADEALYEAKGQGRNRVVFCTTDDPAGRTGRFRRGFWKTA